MTTTFATPAYKYAPKGSFKQNSTAGKVKKNNKYEDLGESVILRPVSKHGAPGKARPPMFGKRMPGFIPEQYIILTGLFDNTRVCGSMPKELFLRTFHLVFSHELMALREAVAPERTVVESSRILSAFNSASHKGYDFMSLDFRNPTHGTKLNIQRIRELFINVEVTPSESSPTLKIIDPSQRRTRIDKNLHKVSPSENGTHGEVTGWDDVENYMLGRYPVCGRADCYTCVLECYNCEDDVVACIGCAVVNQEQGRDATLHRPCTASQFGISLRLPKCGFAICTGCIKMCTKCNTSLIGQCSVCRQQSIHRSGICNGEMDWETLTSDEQLDGLAIANGWFHSQIPDLTNNAHLVTSPLNGSHGEFTETDDFDNIDGLLAQMDNAQVFDNQPNGRERREARNRQHRRPIQNRRANRAVQAPENQQAQGQRIQLPRIPRVNQPAPELNLGVDQGMVDVEQPDDEPAPPEPPRIAVIANVEIPSMGVAEKYMYTWYLKITRNILIVTSGVIMGAAPLMRRLKISFTPETLINRGLKYLVPNVLKYVLPVYAGLSIFRYYRIDLRRIAMGYFNPLGVFTTDRFTKIAPLRKTLFVKGGENATHLALSGYTGVYRGDIYEELVDPCVSKYGTGVLSDCKQGVMSHYMRELLKTTYPGTIVSQKIFANTVVYSTAAILELQNTISSHTRLSKAAYASSSMM